jgi:undecaprenyl diphosphate synthase
MKSNIRSKTVDQSENSLKHIAIIMDGNGRWAKSRRLPKLAGHKKGVDVVRETVRQCVDLNIKYLTLYAFSSENWNRPIDEVNSLMNLLKVYLTKEIAKLHKENINVSFIGSRERLSRSIILLIEDAEKITKNNKKLQLIVALNYGGQEEIVSAAREIAKKVQLDILDVESIDDKVFSDNFHYFYIMPSSNKKKSIIKKKYFNSLL